MVDFDQLMDFRRDCRNEGVEDPAILLPMLRLLRKLKDGGARRQCPSCGYLRGQTALKAHRNNCELEVIFQELKGQKPSRGVQSG